MNQSFAERLAWIPSSLLSAIWIPIGNLSGGFDLFTEDRHLFIYGVAPVILTSFGTQPYFAKAIEWFQQRRRTPRDSDRNLVP